MRGSNYGRRDCGRGGTEKMDAPPGPDDLKKPMNKKENGKEEGTGPILLHARTWGGGEQQGKKKRTLGAQQ